MTTTTQQPMSTGRFRLAQLWHRRSVRAGIVFVVAVAIRIPFRASYLINWDAVNFALGVEAFDLVNHQPHPPGYLGYILLGRVVNWFLGDPVLALTVISIVAGAAATMWVYILGTRLGGERSALVAALLFGTSPLVWYYSEVALTYIVEVALALPLIWLVMETRRKLSVRHLMMATVLLALMGALRQTSLVLFLPLWLYAWLPFSRRTKWITGSLLVGLVLTWLIPLLILSGGPLEYIRLSMELAQLTGGATWFGAGAGVIQNFAVVTTGLILGLHVALLAIPLVVFGRNRAEPFSREHRRLLMLWGLPALLIYLFVHSGQLGYVLILLPIGIIWAARVFDAWIGYSTRLVALAGFMVVINIAGFAIIPSIAYGAVAEGRLSLPERMADPWLFEKGIQQASLPRSDAHWESLITWVEGFDPRTTAVLAQPRDGGSFRHLSFYLPKRLVYGIGCDRGDKVLGHLFTGVRRDIDYSVDRLDEASSLLRLPEQIRTLVIPDPRLQAPMEETLDLKYRRLDDGSRVAVAEINPRSSILFLGTRGQPVVTSWEVGEAISRNLISYDADPDPEIPIDYTTSQRVDPADRHFQNMWDGDETVAQAC